MSKENPQTEIFEYIRRRKGGKTIKVGVIIGRLASDKVIKIGWSKCNFKMGDKFDVAEGVEIAKRRTKDTGIAQEIPPTPLCIKGQVRRFGARCVRYFQDARTLELPA